MGHRSKITRELNELKRIESEGNIPDEFLCPITRELMADPVLVSGMCEPLHTLTLKASIMIESLVPLLFKGRPGWQSPVTRKAS